MQLCKPSRWIPRYHREKWKQWPAVNLAALRPSNPPPLLVDVVCFQQSRPERQAWGLTGILLQKGKRGGFSHPANAADAPDAGVTSNTSSDDGGVEHQFKMRSNNTEKKSSDYESHCTAGSPALAAMSASSSPAMTPITLGQSGRRRVRETGRSGLRRACIGCSTGVWQVQCFKAPRGICELWFAFLKWVQGGGGGGEKTNERRRRKICCGGRGGRKLLYLARKRRIQIQILVSPDGIWIPTPAPTRLP